MKTFRQLLTFGVIGIVSTLAYAVLFLAFRSAVPTQLANALALAATAVGNTAANRRLTFGVTGRPNMFRDHAAGLLAFAFALAITGGSAFGVNTLAPHADHLVELGVLVVANIAATLARFVILRTAVTRPPVVTRPNAA